MQYLRNTWYMAGWAGDLAAGTLLQKKILNEDIVLFRRADGRPAAIGNVCPHRFAPLHLGKLLPGDVVECPYHGLRYDTNGRCVHNPHGNGRINPLARVNAYTVAERHSAIWIWMGNDPADPALIPDLSILDEADPVNVSKRDWIRMNAGYLLIAENLLDLSHASFLHDGILGNEETIAAEVKVEEIGDTVVVDRVAKNSRITMMMDLLYKRDGGKVDAWTRISWAPPAIIRNEVGICEPGTDRSSGTGFDGFHLLTPETDTSTLYYFAAVRWNPLPLPADQAEEIRNQLSSLRRHAFEDQDVVILEAQQGYHSDPCVATDRPALMMIDEGPVKFRRTLDRLIAMESGGSPERGVSLQFSQ